MESPTVERMSMQTMHRERKWSSRLAQYSKFVHGLKETGLHLDISNRPRFRAGCREVLDACCRDEGAVEGQRNEVEDLAGSGGGEGFFGFW